MAAEHASCRYGADRQKPARDTADEVCAVGHGIDTINQIDQMWIATLRCAII